MPRVSVSTTRRDEAQDVCGRFYFPHRLAVLHDPGAFAMSLRAVGLGAVSIGLLGYAGEVCLETGELGTAYEINVPLDGPLRTWTGHADVCATPELAAVYRPDGRARLHGWAGGGGVLGLKIERSALEGMLADLTGRSVWTPVPLGASLDLRRGAGRQWWGLARALAGLIEDPDGPLSRPVVVRPLVHALVSGLLYAVDHPHRDKLDVAPARPRPSAVRAAVELLEADPGQPWTVGDLARQVGVGPRGLQDGFARHVGASPMAHLRTVRLEHAHADLLAGDPAAVTVAEVAARWGFTHPGRFAALYRRRYGRAPSQTLAN